jgi:hypothetical protein
MHGLAKIPIPASPRWQGNGVTSGDKALISVAFNPGKPSETKKLTAINAFTHDDL